MMIDIIEASKRFSERYLVGIRIGFDDSANRTLILRFEGVNDTEFMHFKLQRDWAATSLTIEKDIFGSQAWEHMGISIIRDQQRIRQFLTEATKTLSAIELKLDNKDILHMSNFDGSFSNWSYSSEVLCSESLLDRGLLNEKEMNLIQIALDLFIPLIPIRKSSLINAEEVVGFPEGASVQINVNKYERDPRNRNLCISYYGTKCQACGFDFHEKYGDRGKDFIIVHHVVPVSKIGPDYVIDPIQDLIPLCANCHSMIHRTDPPISVLDLRDILSGRNF